MNETISAKVSLSAVEALRIASILAFSASMLFCNAVSAAARALASVATAPSAYVFAAASAASA